MSREEFSDRSNRRTSLRADLVARVNFLVREVSGSLDMGFYAELSDGNRSKFVS